jgi:hypothetical protein
VVVEVVCEEVLVEEEEEEDDGIRCVADPSLRITKNNKMKKK